MVIGPAVRSAGEASAVAAWQRQQRQQRLSALALGSRLTARGSLPRLAVRGSRLTAHGVSLQYDKIKNRTLTDSRVNSRVNSIYSPSQLTSQLDI